MRYRIDLTKMACPGGRLGRLRRRLALWLWPQLAQPQIEEGVLEYYPAPMVD